MGTIITECLGTRLCIARARYCYLSEKFVLHTLLISNQLSTCGGDTPIDAVVRATTGLIGES